MATITRVETLRDTPERLVVRVRYSYRDEIVDEDTDDSGGLSCRRFAERTFSVTNTDDGPKVIEMSGPKRAPVTGAA